MEHEEFLTPDDFGKESINKRDLDYFNDHPDNEDEKLIKAETEENVIDEERIGFTPTGLPMYKTDDPGEIYKIVKEEKPKDTLMDLREKQFRKIQEVQEKMKNKGDKRHLFLVKKGAFVVNCGGKFWRGNLSQDTLGVKGKTNLELRPLLSSEIKFDFESSRFGQRVVKTVPHPNVLHRGVEKIDLTEKKFNNAKELYMALLPKKK